jgi:hypothetical protein
LFLGPIVATVAAGVLMLAGLHGQADRAKRRASADAPTLFGAIHEPVSYGGTAGLETTRVDATGGVATLATTDGAIAEVRPAAHDRSPEPTPPRRSNPKETHARTSAQPAPTRRYAGPPALEEFLNERR